MPSPLRRVSAALAASLPFLLPAQAPPPVEAVPALPWPAGTVLTETAADGVVWAAAGGWKAAFAAEGATFTPFLGSAVPSRSARFRLASVTAGGTPLRLGDAAPVLHERRVSYDRGAATELFDLREDGVEHQFVLPSLPDRGELRLQIAVDTELLAARDGDGHVFACADGGIRYGAAFAIDAAGERLPLATEWTGTALQIVVPAAFVARAELPLLVDPLIGSSTSLPPSAAELRSTDIAYDYWSHYYFVTWERLYSATDHDVYVGVYDDANMAHLSTLTIDFTTACWAKPKIATIDTYKVACVVAEHSTGNVAPFSVAVRRVYYYAGLAVQPSSVLSSATNNDYRDPAIGGDATWNALAGSFLLAWTSENPVAGTADIALFSSPWNGPVSPVGTIALPGTLERQVAIGKSCGSSNSIGGAWAVVFRRETPGSGSGQLAAAIVDTAGPTLRTFQGQPCFLLGGPTLNPGSQWAVSSPTNLAQGHRFLCAERVYDPINLRGSIRGHVFDRDGNVIVTSQVLVSGPNDERQPAVDCDGLRFVLAASRRLSSSDADVHVRTLGLVGSQLVQHDYDAASYSLDYDGYPAVCAERQAGLNQYGLAFVRRTNGTSWAVHAQLYRGTAPPNIVQRATACGWLGITRSGEPALGESITFQLSNNAGFPGFVVGAPVSLPVGPCPGCTQGASGTTVFGPIFQLIVPPDAALVGLQFAAQGFRFALGGLPCLGQVEVSDTIDFTIQ